MCQRTTGSLLRVEHIKFLDLNIIKTLTKHSILRVDAKKGKHNLFFKKIYLGNARLFCLYSYSFQMEVVFGKQVTRILQIFLISQLLIQIEAEQVLQFFWSYQRRVQYSTLFRTSFHQFNNLDFYLFAQLQHLQRQRVSLGSSFRLIVKNVFFSVDFLVNQIPHNFQDKIIDDVKNALPLMGVLICARMNRTMK